MGMSASQARLLSITSRLTNNEFRSQTITNSKLRLASESEFASQKYMDALEQKQLMFMCYDDDGAATKTPLTAAVLYNYGDVKNQYSLINPAGKVLVSSQDAENFEKTNNLEEFLSKYDLVEETDGKKQFDIDYTQYEKDKEKYDNDIVNYQKELADYNKAKADYEQEYKDYIGKLKVYQQKKAEYDKEYAKYKESLDQKDLAAIFTGIVGTSQNPTAYCYEHALNGEAGCYLHLLNHLLDFEGVWPRNWDGVEYEASSGDKFTPNNTSYGGMGETNELVEISEAINEKDEDGNYKRVCDGDDDIDTPEKENILASNPNPSKLDILRSDYKTDGSIKSLRQKTIDMYYMIQNQSALGIDGDMMNKMLRNFTDGDMKKLTLPKPEFTEVEPTLDATEPTFDLEEPEKPAEPTPPVYEIQVNNKSKAQWYTNLWNKMNGLDTSEKVKQFTEEGTSAIEFTIENVSNSIKNPNKTNYEIFEDNLYTSPEWLLFALEHGIIMMEKATFTDPTEVENIGLGLTSSGFTWKATPYTSAADIISQDNEKAIAIAEVQYKKEITEIENKDKKYDQDLKKLDTEHNALQTEYESIREAINKNVERSFKAFS